MGNSGRHSGKSNMNEELIRLVELLLKVEIKRGRIIKTLLKEVTARRSAIKRGEAKDPKKAMEELAMVIKCVEPFLEKST